MKKGLILLIIMFFIITDNCFALEDRYSNLASEGIINFIIIVLIAYILQKIFTSKNSKK